MLCMFTINSEAFKNIIEDDSFLLLKKELFSFIFNERKNLGLDKFDKITNYDFQELAKGIIYNSYKLDDKGKKVKAFYIFPKFPDIGDYYDMLDYITIYTYRLAQCMYIKESNHEYFNESITEMVFGNQEVFEEHGFKKGVPLNLLSINYLTNTYIKGFLSDDDYNFLARLDWEELTERKKMYRYFADDVLTILKHESEKAPKTKVGVKNEKDLLFLFVQCLRHLEYTDKEIKHLIFLLELLNIIDLEKEAIQNIMGSKTYNFGEKSLIEKINYSKYPDLELNFTKENV